jgi:hypothetical protein
MSVIKNVPIRESINFEMRAEAKNAMNHPNWGGPNLNPTTHSSPGHQRPRAPADHAAR